MIDAALVRNDVESAAFWYKKSADELTLPTEAPWQFEPTSGPRFVLATMGKVFFLSSEPAELRCTVVHLSSYMLYFFFRAFGWFRFFPIWAFGASKL